jgi:hypothetical protein
VISLPHRRLRESISAAPALLTSEIRRYPLYRSFTAKAPVVPVKPAVM